MSAAKTTTKYKGTAYSYIRFSSLEQEQGDSVRRQKELRDGWLSRNPGVKLDGTTLEDLGVPAYRGMNRDDKYALGHFLKLIDSAPQRMAGSFFIVESLDRLTRDEIGEGTELFLSIVNRGVRVVVLTPQEHVFAKPVELTELIVAIVELSRAGSESAVKGQRVSQKWSERKRQAAATGAIVTARCPAWLLVKNGRFQFQPKAKGVIRRVFEMSTTGHGARSVAATLNRENVPPWGGVKWEEAYIRKILSGREVLGEYQPCRVEVVERLQHGKTKKVKVRVPDGDPIPGYYPSAVTQEEWDRAAGARGVRNNRHSGRPPKDGKHVNIFGGLINDAMSGGTVHIAGRIGHRKNSYRVLVPGAYKRHGEKCSSFDLDAFEQAVLSQLAEINPAEILPAAEHGNRQLELAGQLKTYEGRLAAAKAQMVEGDQDVGVLMDGIRELVSKCKATADDLAAERQRAVSPLSEAWGECRGLIGALESAPDQREARIRLRGVIRRVVKEIWTLFTAVGAWRLAAVQIWFEGNRHRDYLIVRRAARPNHDKMLPAVLSVRSFATTSVKGEFDLRKRADAVALEKALTRINPRDLG